MSWPKEWGGPGWTAIQKMIFLEENQMAPAPELSSFNITMIGPVLLQFGTEEQKKRFLPRAANLDDWWCQGFSEPGAGSDLASLKTAAKLEGDHYIVNGQKIWTSTAHQRRLVLRAGAHQSERAQAAGGYFVPAGGHEDAGDHGAADHFDRRQPSPQRSVFDDVKVPVALRVYQENKGWDVAKFLLGNERTGIARLGKSRERVNTSIDLARKVNIERQAADRGSDVPPARRADAGRHEGVGDHAVPRRFRLR